MLAGAGFVFLAIVLLGCTRAAPQPTTEVQRQLAGTSVPATSASLIPSPSPGQVLLTPTASSVAAPVSTVTPLPTPTPVPPTATANHVTPDAPRATPPPPPTEAPPKPTARALPVATPAVPASSQGPGGDQAGVPASSSAAAGEKSLAIIQNRDWTFIRNGGSVNLGNRLSVDLFLTPYPPAQLTAVLDLYITRGGQTVTDASVGVTYDMLGMVHGPFVSTAKNLGNGHYALTIDYIEFAAWEHKLAIYLPEDHYGLEIGIVVSPTRR